MTEQYCLIFLLMYSDPFDTKAFIMLLQSLGDGSVSSVSSLNLFFFGKKPHPFMHLKFSCTTQLVPLPHRII